MGIRSIFNIYPRAVEQKNLANPAKNIFRRILKICTQIFLGFQFLEYNKLNRASIKAVQKFEIDHVSKKDFLCFVERLIDNALNISERSSFLRKSNQKNIEKQLLTIYEELSKLLCQIEAIDPSLTENFGVNIPSAISERLTLLNEIVGLEYKEVENHLKDAPIALSNHRNKTIIKFKKYIESSHLAVANQHDNISTISADIKGKTNGSKSSPKTTSINNHQKASYNYCGTVSRQLSQSHLLMIKSLKNQPLKGLNGHQIMPYNCWGTVSRQLSQSHLLMIKSLKNKPLKGLNDHQIVPYRFQEIDEDIEVSPQTRQNHILLIEGLKKTLSKDESKNRNAKKGLNGHQIMPYNCWGTVSRQLSQNHLLMIKSLKNKPLKGLNDHQIMAYKYCGTVSRQLGQSHLLMIEGLKAVNNHQIVPYRLEEIDVNVDASPRARKNHPLMFKNLKDELLKATNKKRKFGINHQKSDKKKANTSVNNHQIVPYRFQEIDEDIEVSPQTRQNHILLIENLKKTLSKDESKKRNAKVNKIVEDAAKERTIICISNNVENALFRGINQKRNEMHLDTISSPQEVSNDSQENNVKKLTSSVKKIIEKIQADYLSSLEKLQGIQECLIELSNGDGFFSIEILEVMFQEVILELDQKASEIRTERTAATEMKNFEHCSVGSNLDDLSKEFQMLNKMKMLLKSLDEKTDQEYQDELDQIFIGHPAIVAEDLVENTKIQQRAAASNKYIAKTDYTQNVENLSLEIARFKKWIKVNYTQTFYSESFYKEDQELSALEAELNMDGSYFSLNQLVKCYEELVNRVNIEVSEIPLSANYGQMRIEFSRNVSNIRMGAEAGVKAVETQIKALDVKIDDVRLLMISRRPAVMANIQGHSDVLTKLLNERKTLFEKYKIEFMHTEYASFIENLSTNIDDMKFFLSSQVSGGEFVSLLYDKLKAMELDLARLAKGSIRRPYLEALEANFLELSKKINNYFGLEN